jgi:superfamily II DNA/RNA helicase
MPEQNDPNATEATTPTPAEPAKKSGDKKPDDAGAGGAQTFTAADLEARVVERVQAALRQKDEKDAAARKKEKDETDRKAAEEQGRWKELADEEAKKRAAAEADAARLKADLRRGQVKEQIREYLDGHHKGYAGAEKWILPTVEFDAETAAEDVTKRVKAAADLYVKDNPRPSGGAGVTADGRSGVPSGANVPRKDRANGQPARELGVAGRSF